MESVEALSRLPGVDAVLVEADGARMMPLKAPADHEPVIPASTRSSCLWWVWTRFGQPLTEAHVHRSAQVAALTGLELGEPIAPKGR